MTTKARWLCLLLAPFLMASFDPAEHVHTKICTASTISISPDPALPGAIVTLIGRVTQAASGRHCRPGRAGAPVTQGKIHLDEKEVAGQGVDCVTPGLCTAGKPGAVCSSAADCGVGGACTLSEFETIAIRSPNADGQFAARFNPGSPTTSPAADAPPSSGNSQVCFRNHYVGGNTRFIGSLSLADLLGILLGAQQWPMFHHDPSHTALSQFDTSGDNGVQRWRFGTSGPVDSSPAIAPDGTVIVGSSAVGVSSQGNLYGIRPDGSQKTRYTIEGSFISAPLIDIDGSFYAGADDGNLYAFNSDGTLRWIYTEAAAISSSPVLGSDGTIYAGWEDGNLVAVTPAGGFKWAFATDGAVTSPAIGSDGTIYVTSPDGNLYAVNSGGSQIWSFNPQSEIVSPATATSSPAIGADRTIYVDGAVNDAIDPVVDGFLYAINPDGTQKWIVGPDSLFEIPLNSTPAIGKDGTLYVEDGLGSLYAFGASGQREWTFPGLNCFGGVTGADPHSPAVGKDGTIYFGRCFEIIALNPDGSEKWSFPTGDQTQSSPAIGIDGTVYVGSNDDHLYAIH